MGYTNDPADADDISFWYLTCSTINIIIGEKDIVNAVFRYKVHETREASYYN